MRDPNGPERPLLRASLSTAWAVLPMAALLLVPAGLVRGGTWLWPNGLAFMGAYGMITLAGNLLLAVHRPAHFEVRQQGVVAPQGHKQPRIDAIGSAALVAYALAWLAFVPLDVFRLRLLPTPGSAISAAGGVCVLVGAALTPLAVWENRFATPNVQDQSAQGQQVIDTGVYGLIRHPIYAGNLLLFAGAALWLGSYAALVGVAVLLVATVARILIEESYLRANVAGYLDYEKRVRARLVPFVL